MGSEYVFIFGRWRKVYYDRNGGEYVFMPTNKWVRSATSKRTKFYLKDYSKLRGE